jgi:type IV pilus assembly protein PilP
VAEPDAQASPQGQAGQGAAALAPDPDLMLSAPKPPDDPAALPVYNEMNKWHRDMLMAYRVNLTTVADPFMPIETVMRPPAQEQQRDPEAVKRLPLIQRSPLNSFTLTAITVHHQDPNKSTALVDLGGVGYLIRKGSKIGPNNGVVSQITDDTVVIEEQETSYRGDKRTRTTELKLNPMDLELPEGGILDDGSA